MPGTSMRDLAPVENGGNSLFFLKVFLNALAPVK